MSSKVLSPSDGRAATPIEWGKMDFTPAGYSVTSPKSPGQEGRAAHLEAALAQLQQRYDADVAAAHRRGVSEGEAHAKAGPAGEMEAATQRLAQSVRDLAQLRPRLRRDAEADVVRLSLAIARRILHREMSVDPGAMQALAQVALQKLGRQEISRVYVHPNQAPAIKATLETAGVRAEVIPEITRESGALVFETNQGLLDASVNAQLEEIERGLTDRVNQS
jgi:flagellar assembly protein FliH